MIKVAKTRNKDFITPQSVETILAKLVSIDSHASAENRTAQGCNYNRPPAVALPLRAPTPSATVSWQIQGSGLWGDSGRKLDLQVHVSEVCDRPRGRASGSNNDRIAGNGISHHITFVRKRWLAIS